MVGELDSHKCILAGVGLRKAARRLRPGIPRKRDKGMVSVTWVARGDTLEIHR